LTPEAAADIITTPSLGHHEVVPCHWRNGGPFLLASDTTRAQPLAASGQNCWPRPGSYMAATGHDLMAADTDAHIPLGDFLFVLELFQ
jgi:hypothetical protein